MNKISNNIDNKNINEQILDLIIKHFGEKINLNQDMISDMLTLKKTIYHNIKVINNLLNNIFEVNKEVSRSEIKTYNESKIAEYLEKFLLLKYNHYLEVKDILNKKTDEEKETVKQNLLNEYDISDSLFSFFEDLEKLNFDIENGIVLIKELLIKEIFKTDNLEAIEDKEQYIKFKIFKEINDNINLNSDFKEKNKIFTVINDVLNKKYTINLIEDFVDFYTNIMKEEPYKNFIPNLEKKLNNKYDKKTVNKLIKYIKTILEDKKLYPADKEKKIISILYKNNIKDKNVINFINENFKIKYSLDFINYFKNRKIDIETLKKHGVLELKYRHLKALKTRIENAALKLIKDNKYIKYVFLMPENEFLNIIKNYSLKKYNEYLKNYNNFIEDYTTLKNKLIKNELTEEDYKFLSKLFLALTGLERNGDLVFKNHRILYQYNDNNNNTKMIEGRLLSLFKKDNGNEVIKTGTNTTVEVKKNTRYIKVGKVIPYNLKTVNDYDTIVITEGPNDTLVLEQLGIPAIAIPGTNNKLDEDIKKLFIGKRIIIWTDFDEPGQELKERLEKELEDVAYEIKTVKKEALIDNNLKDINEFYINFGEKFIYNKLLETLDIELTEEEIEKLDKNNIKEVLNIKKIKNEKINIEENNNKEILKLENIKEDILPPIRTTMYDTYTLGKKEDIIQFIKEKNINTFGIIETGFKETNEYVEFSIDNGLNFQLYKSIDIGNIKDVIVYLPSWDKYEEFIDLYNKKDGKFKIKDIEELIKLDAKIIIPLEYNKYLNTLKTKYNNNNIFIGIPAQMNEKYLKNLKYLNYEPVFININKYLKEEDYINYNLNKVINDNIKLTDKKEIERELNSNKGFQVYTLKDIYNKLKNNIPENKLNYLITNTFKFYKNNNSIKEIFNKKLSFPVETLIEDKEELEIFKNSTKEVKNKILINKLKKVINFLINKDLNEEYVRKNKLPTWVLNIPKKLAYKKEFTENKEIYLNRLSEEFKILEEYNKLENTEYNIFPVYETFLAKELQGKVKGLGRGSAPSFLINHILNITDIDPVKYNLKPARFLSPKVTEDMAKMKNPIDIAPDIDIDIGPNTKRLLENELTKKYNAGKIIVNEENTEKATLRKFLNILEVEQEEISEIFKLYDDKKEDNTEFYIKYKDVLKTKLLNFFNGDINKLEKLNLNPENLLDSIDKIIGEFNKEKTHPAAILVGNSKPFVEYYYKEDNNGNLQKVYKITQEASNEINGWIKFDFLSLKFIEQVEEINKLRKNKYFEDLKIPKYSSSYIEKIDNEINYKKILKIGFEKIPQLEANTTSKMIHKMSLFKLLNVKNIEELANFLTIIRKGALIFANEYIENQIKENPANFTKFGSILKKDFKNIKEFQQLLEDNRIKKEYIKNPKFNFKYKIEKIFEDTGHKDLKLFIKDKSSNEYIINPKLRTTSIDMDMLLKIFIPNKLGIKIEELYNYTLLDLYNIDRLLDIQKDLIIKNFFVTLDDKYKKILKKYFNEDININFIKGKVPDLYKILKELNLTRKNEPNYELFKNYMFDLILKNNPILKEISNKYKTYGTLIYQEQIMELLEKIGMDIGDITILRKALSKKKVEVLDKYKDEVIEEFAKKLKITLDEANYLWNKIEKTAEYTFNKAHAISYAMNVYYSMYLKINLPVVFTYVNNITADKEKEKINNKFILDHPILKFKNFDKELLIKWGNNYKILPPINNIDILKRNKKLAEILQNNILPIKNFDDFIEKTNKYKEYIRFNHIIELLNNKVFTKDEIKNSKYIERFIDLLDEEVLEYYNLKRTYIEEEFEDDTEKLNLF